MARKKSPRPNTLEDKMARSLDQLAAFDEYCSDVLPILRQAIQEGWTADQIEGHPKIKAMLVARQVTIALQDKDSSKALAAIKDSRDRTTGKAVERRDVKLSLENAPDEQLDAKLKTLLGETIGADSDSDMSH